MTSLATVALGDMVASVDSWTPERDDPSGSFTYIDLSAVDQERKEISGARVVPCGEAPSRARQLVRSGDVLVSTVRPNLNGVARVPANLDGATASTGFCVLRPRTEKLDRGYLFHWVRSPRFAEEMVRKASGASYPAVSDRIVLESKLPVLPLSEQNRIAEILDKACALRAKRRAALAQLDILAQSIFLAMFGDPIFNPKGWQTCSLEDVAKKITDGTHKTPSYRDSGIEFLSAKDLKDGGIEWGTGKFISEEEHRELSKRCNPELGDILLAKSGSLGSVAIVDRSQQLSLFESLCLIKHDRERVDGRYLTGLLRVPTMLAHLLGKNKGVAIKHLHLIDVRNLKIPLPPLQSQRDFSRRLSVTEKLKMMYRGSLAELYGLFTTLQYRAFRGEL